MEAVRHVSMSSLSAMAEEAAKLTNPKLRTVQRFIHQYFGGVYGQLIVDLNVTGLAMHDVQVLHEGYASRRVLAQEILDLAGIKISEPSLVTAGEHDGVTQRALRFELDIQSAKLDTLSERETFLSVFPEMMKVLLPSSHRVPTRDDHSLHNLCVLLTR